MLILTASNGKNRALAELVAERAQALGHGSELIDLVALDLPLFTPVRQAAGAGEPLEILAAVLRQQQRLWVCAPEYNGSLPPTLVNAIAWLSTSTADFRALFQGCRWPSPATAAAAARRWSALCACSSPIWGPW